jgi:hypothetical protein
LRHPGLEIDQPPEIPMPLNEPSAVPAAPDDLTVAAAVARLSVEFAPDVHPAVIGRVVARSRVDLSGVPVPALPELVERLARQRLLQSAGAETAEVPHGSRYAATRVSARPAGS